MVDPLSSRMVFVELGMVGMVLESSVLTGDVDKGGITVSSVEKGMRTF